MYILMNWALSHKERLLGFPTCRVLSQEILVSLDLLFYVIFIALLKFIVEIFQV